METWDQLSKVVELLLFSKVLSFLFPSGLFTTISLSMLENFLVIASLVVGGLVGLPTLNFLVSSEGSRAEAVNLTVSGLSSLGECLLKFSLSGLKFSLSGLRFSLSWLMFSQSWPRLSLSWPRLSWSWLRFSALLVSSIFFFFDLLTLCQRTPM